MTTRSYTKSNNFHPCKLELKDLRKLTTLMCEGFPEPDSDNARSNVNFNISAQLTDGRITAHSLEDFQRHADLPNTLNNLTVEIIEWNPHRTIRLIFEDWYGNLYISGENEAWMLGKYTQVTKHLALLKPWHWFTRSKWFSGFVVGLYIITCLGVARFYNSNQKLYVISSTIFLMSLISLHYLHSKAMLAPYTQIIIQPTKSFFSEKTIPIIVGVLSLIVSVIGLFVKN